MHLPPELPPKLPPHTVAQDEMGRDGGGWRSAKNLDFRVYVGRGRAGRDGRNRIAKPLLCQLSYRTMVRRP